MLEFFLFWYQWLFNSIQFHSIIASISDQFDYSKFVQFSIVFHLITQHCRYYNSSITGIINIFNDFICCFDTTISLDWNDNRESSQNNVNQASLMEFVFGFYSVGILLDPLTKRQNFDHSTHRQFSFNFPFFVLAVHSFDNLLFTLKLIQIAVRLRLFH